MPFWLQQGVITWNKSEIELENGSKINAYATSEDAARGDPVGLLIVDETILGSSLVTVREKENFEVKKMTLKELFLDL